MPTIILNLHHGWPPDPLPEHSQHTLAPKPSYHEDHIDHVDHPDHGSYGNAEKTKAIADPEQTKREAEQVKTFLSNKLNSLYI